MSWRPHDHDYTDKLAQAGFERISMEPTRVYDMNDARQFLTGQGLDMDVIAPPVAGKFMSAFVRAEKPRTRRGRPAAPNTAPPQATARRCCPLRRKPGL